MITYKLVFFVTLIFFIAIYITCMILSYVHIQDSICTLGFTYRERVIRHYKEDVIGFGCVLFPLYWCFLYGAFVGEETYKKLIDNNDENRLASWVI